MDDNPPHYFYIPFEYLLLTLFYRKNTKSLVLKKIMLWSIYGYIFFAIVFNIIDNKFEHYPSGIYNVSCVFNIIWIGLLLYDLENLENLEIISVPMFWILASLLLFYSGIFFFNASYNYFIKTDTALAINLRTYVNTMLNNILYLTLAYAFSCSWRNKKFSYQ
ncbi:MAG TPA: hypothetical protein PLP23_03790 [Panacibacter sp.]|nr:hypothetical protein [Panacibacter sp.]